MTRTRISLAAPAALALALVAGCSGSKAGDKTIDTTESQAAGKALAASIEDSAAAVGPADQGAAFASSSTCYTLSGDTSDTDGDHIPANATLTFTNCVKTQGNVTATFNGTEAAHDDQPAVATFAFTLSVDGTLDLAAAGGATETVHRTGSIVGTTPSAGTYQLAHDRTTTIDAQGNGQTFAATENYQLTTTYTPSGAWTPGSGPVGGTYTANGSWDATVNGANANATVATTTPLTFDPSCETHVTAGVITATFTGPNATRTLTVTWSGCGARTVQYTETPN